jgi:pimeloyl-ACP methyl ester carboxylesterase
MVTEGFADFQGAQTWFRVYGELPAAPHSSALGATTSAGPAADGPAADVAGCSHLPMWEKPDVYRAAVERWLRRHD